MRGLGTWLLPVEVKAEERVEHLALCYHVVKHRCCRALRGVGVRHAHNT